MMKAFTTVEAAADYLLYVWKRQDFKSEFYGLLHFCSENMTPLFMKVTHL